MKKKLAQKITNQLETLQELLNQIAEAQAIEPTDPDTWDADTLYNLVENLKETLVLLEDKENARQLDLAGEPITGEIGLCSLVDEYHSEADD